MPMWMPMSVQAPNMPATLAVSGDASKALAARRTRKPAPRHAFRTATPRPLATLPTVKDVTIIAAMFVDASIGKTARGTPHCAHARVGSARASAPAAWTRWFGCPGRCAGVGAGVGDAGHPGTHVAQVAGAALL